MRLHLLVGCMLVVLSISSGCRPESAPEVASTGEQQRDSLASVAVEAATGVFINGTEVSLLQVAELEQRYGVRPQPGRYWYDQRSGLYGVEGYAAFGFMLAGHSLGSMPRGASNGSTGVLVNGRELPNNEWLLWSQLLGYPIQQGAYWLDEQGNAGNEGSPIPTVNLYMAAQQNGFAGGGGGDNFWSSRFSAGNYDTGNQRGYVSVPGHGPVGYGF